MKDRGRGEWKESRHVLEVKLVSRWKGWGRRESQERLVHEGGQEHRRASLEGKVSSVVCMWGLEGSRKHLSGCVVSQSFVIPVLKDLS